MMRLSLLLILAATFACAQNATSSDDPLPDIPTLLHAVENQQKLAEAAQKDYTYKVFTLRQETDSRGSVKKTSTMLADSLTIEGVRVNRLVQRNGKDLTPEEQKKESIRIDKEVAKARDRRNKNLARGRDVYPNGNEEITVSRFLQLGAFSNPRREMLNGITTIAVDFTGDPKAKTSNRAEALIRDLAGTLWINEPEKAIVRIEGHAVDDFRIGGGLVASLKKGTSFILQNTRIVDAQTGSPVWLPAQIDAHGSLRYLLFFSFNGSVHITCSDYRRFQASSTILPDLHPVPPTNPPSSNQQ